MRVRMLTTVTVITLLSGLCLAQASDPEAQVPTIVKDVWASAGPAVQSQHSGRRLSTKFAVSALNTNTALRDWQKNLESTLRNGYPFAEQWVWEHRDLASDQLWAATTSAKTGADNEVLQSLIRQYNNLLALSEAVAERAKRLDLAELNMSREALDNDPLFQQTATCAHYLNTVFVVGNNSEMRSCN